MQDEFIDDQPPIGQLTDDARESLRLAIADTPADHPDRAGHTPGPWSIDTYRPGDKDLFVSEAGVTVDIDDCTELERAERFANARLIAAAPELLKACRMMSSCHGFTPWAMESLSLPERKAVTAMRAAIAKATWRDTP